jgi:hypothetical protein
MTPPPKTPVSKPGQKGGASGKGQGKGGRTDPGGPVSPPAPGTGKELKP